MASSSSFSSMFSVIFMLLLATFVGLAYGGVSFKSLPRTLAVEASPKGDTELMVGSDTITVAWSLNASSITKVEGYKSVKVWLCYAPTSQMNRAWRKANNDLAKDKTCQFAITSKPFDSSKNESYTYELPLDIPTGSYFVRAYALDSSATQVGYGQTSPKYFAVKGISGRTVGLDIAAACFSAFSVLSLIGYFVVEKMVAKNK